MGILVSIYNNYTNLEWELDIFSFYYLLKIIIGSMLNIFVLQGSHNAYIYNPTFLDLCQHMTVLYKFPS